MTESLITHVAKSTISLEEYKSLFGNHPGGVAVITVGCAKPVGFTATSVISVSAEPPLLVFSINKASSSWPSVAEASSAVVHFLSKHDRKIADRFATSGIDRFSDLDCTRLDSGDLKISEVETWAQGTLVDRMDVGSSVVFVLQIEKSSVAEVHEPLVYRARNYYQLADDSKLT